MRPIVWTDERGYHRRTLVRNNDPDSAAPLGIPDGPPDLDLIDWEDLKREINNDLVKTGIFTWQDAQANGSTAFLHAQAALKRRLVALYREVGTKTKTPE